MSKRKKQTKKELKKEKDAIDKLKTEFVALASHQIRTPLLTINWYVEALLNGDAGKLNKKQEGYLRQAYEGNQRLMELVNDFLNISQIDLGTFVTKTSTVSLIETSESVLKELIPYHKGRNLKIKKDYGKGVPLIKADPKFIRIIFQNLISNAMKYTPKGGEVGVSVQSDKKEVVIKIYDTGIGIPKSQQKRVFSRLFRAKNAKKRMVEGTGLGLYIIKLVVDRMKGKIDFESVENKGTTFFVTLPLKGIVINKKSKK